MKLIKAHVTNYRKNLNKSYELEGDNKVTLSKLGWADNTTTRQVKKAETHFNLLPENIPVFDHFSPAMWLLQNPKIFDDNSNGVEITLNNAKNIFKRLNKLII